MSDSTTPWTISHQVPLSMEFSRQEYWSGLAFPSPGDLSDPGIEPRSPALQVDSLSLSYQESPSVIKNIYIYKEYTLTHIYGIAPNIHMCVCIYTHTYIFMDFPGDSVIKNPPAMQETWVPSLCQEDPLEKRMPTHSSILAWRVPLHLYVYVFVLIDWSIDK